MSDFDEKIIERLRRLEREIERLKVKEKVTEATIDHGLLTGLADDDHPQYVKDTGDETIAGVKTFSSIPVLPASNPTTDNQAVRKGFADATYGRPVFLTSSLDSTSWDGDLFSTTAKTKIDLSSVFGVPAGVKAVLIRLVARDSGSSSATCQLAVSPNDTVNTVVVQVYLQGLANNVYRASSGICPCDSNGDIYYQIAASGTNTLQAWMHIWGYWL